MAMMSAALTCSPKIADTTPATSRMMTSGLANSAASSRARDRRRRGDGCVRTDLGEAPRRLLRGQPARACRQTGRRRDHQRARAGSGRAFAPVASVISARSHRASGR